jgi:hypothetical protein
VSDVKRKYTQPQIDRALRMIILLWFVLQLAALISFGFWIWLCSLLANAVIFMFGYAIHDHDPLK